MEKALFETNLIPCTGNETVVLHYFPGVHTEIGGLFTRSGVFFSGTPETLRDIISQAAEWNCRVDVLAVGESTSHPSSSMDTVECFNVLKSNDLRKLALCVNAAAEAGLRLRGGPVTEEEKQTAHLEAWQEADNLTEWGWLKAVAKTKALQYARA